MKTILSTLALVGLTAVTVLAQADIKKSKPVEPPKKSQTEKDAEKETDDSGKKKQIITFGKSKADEAEDKKTTTESDTKNAVWLEALSYFAGYIDVGYERELSNTFSIEVAAGITMSDKTQEFGDIILAQTTPTEAVNDRKEYWAANGYTPDVLTGVFVGRSRDYNNGYGVTYTPATGLYLLLEPKIYPNEDVLDGGFWGFRAEYMSFNSLTPKPITGEYTNGSSSILFSSTEKLPVSRTNIDLAIMKGYVFPLQKLLINIELGAGARFAAVNGYDTGVRQTAAGNPEFAIRNNFTETAVMPLFLGAVKLGYAF